MALQNLAKMNDTIENARNFMLDFTRKEFELFIARYTNTLDDDEFEKMHTSFLNFFLEKFVSFKLTQYNRIEGDLSDIGQAAQFKQFSIERKLYAVLKYENPVLGPLIGESLSIHVYYRAILGENLQHFEGGMAEAFDFYMQDNEFKIFGRNTFENGVWKSTHKLTEFQILENGDLVEVLNISPPQEEEHLTYYNSLKG